MRDLPLSANACTPGTDHYVQRGLVGVHDVRELFRGQLGQLFTNLEANYVEVRTERVELRGEVNIRIDLLVLLIQHDNEVNHSTLKRGNWFGRGSPIVFNPRNRIVRDNPIIGANRYIRRMRASAGAKYRNR